MFAFFLTVVLSTIFGYVGPETILVDIINHERQLQGIAPLEMNWEVARLARYKTDEMIRLQYFGHESPVYGTPSEMLARFHICAASVGANIAMGQACPQEVADAWLSSPPHRVNIFCTDYSQVGVGHARCDDFDYWTLILLP